jgi:hypothetical protein
MAITGGRYRGQIGIADCSPIRAFQAKKLMFRFGGRAQRQPAIYPRPTGNVNMI